jgi:hypothetical protein
MIINVIIEKNKDGLWAYAENIKSVVGHGENLEQIKQSVIECVETLKKTNSCPIELKVEYTLKLKLT